MKIREETQKHLDDYARRGLRTLCIAKKVRLLSTPQLFWFLPLFSHLIKTTMRQTLMQVLRKVLQLLSLFRSLSIPYISWLSCIASIFPGITFSDFLCVSIYLEKFSYINSYLSQVKIHGIECALERVRPETDFLLQVLNQFCCCCFFCAHNYLNPGKFSIFLLSY